MKIVAIGDIHGRGLWKEVINKELASDIKPDIVVFIADYFDSRDGISVEDQINNFLDIIEWKEKIEVNGVDAVLLIGNHDYHYLPEVHEKYSNYQKYAAASITKVLEENKKHLQMAFAYENFLFTHAGVSRAFCEAQGIQYDVTVMGAQLTAISIAEDVNDRFEIEPLIFGFTPDNFMDNHGESTSQTPIWIRPKSLGESIIPGIEQIVGHTTVDNITTVRNVSELKEKQYITSVTLIDTIAVRQYLVIENNIMRTETF